MISIGFKNPLHEGQQYIWDKFILDTSVKRCVINTGRQWGKTTLCKRSVLKWITDDPGCEVGWITPESKHFYKVFNWFRSIDAIVERADSQKSVIYFKNGSILYFYSVENYDAIRGQTFQYRILDEFAFGRFGQLEAIAAYEATFVASGKKDLIVSTPKGKNQHYKYFQRSMRREDEMVYEAKSVENPMIKEEDLEAIKKQYPLSLFQQEYEGKFLDNVGGVFGDISKNLIVNEYHEQWDGPVYVGVDIATTGDDDTTVAVLAQDGTVVKIERWNDGITTNQIDRIASILRRYNVDRCNVESNTEVGIYQSLEMQFPGVVHAFRTTAQSKPPAVQNFKKDLEDGHIKLPVANLDPICHDELTSYIGIQQPNGYMKYSHPVGGHDDTVDALWLANEARVIDRHSFPVKTGIRIRKRY